MKRIQDLSRYVVLITKILMIAIPSGFALVWLLMETRFINDLVLRGILLRAVDTPEGLVNLAQVQWTFWSKSIAIFGNFVGMLPFYGSLFLVNKIFSNYQTGQIFLTKNAAYYRKLGVLCFLEALITTPVAGMLMVLGVTLSNAPGHRYLSVSFGTPGIGGLLTGLVIMTISWVMYEGAKIEEDQRHTI